MRKYPAYNPTTKFTTYCIHKYPTHPKKTCLPMDALAVEIKECNQSYSVSHVRFSISRIASAAAYTAIFFTYKQQKYNSISLRFRVITGGYKLKGHYGIQKQPTQYLQFILLGSMGFWEHTKFLCQPNAFLNILRRNKVKGHFSA